MNQGIAAQNFSAPGESRSKTSVPNEALFPELKAAISPDAVLRADERLASRTTLRVGGNADFYAEPASEADLTRLLQVCERAALPFFILGRGSNLLIRDGGIRGLVICLAHPHFSRIEITGYRLHCGAGAKLKQVSVLAKQSQLTGLEFLEGIPGTVGGALRMNAGAMGGWMFDVVESVRYMDHSGQAHEEPAAQVKVEYRCCPLFKENIALGAVLKGHPASREVVEKRMKTFSQKRWDSQPAAPSAGCIFKNPGTIPAGKLIDELGLKGTKVGGAAVSEEHGNFIINEGSATARDVLELIETIRQRAKSERGIDLETEVEIVGEA
jgi:UDP-N-acetylenolpyruvoylglucosamine reductase